MQKLTLTVLAGLCTTLLYAAPSIEKKEEKFDRKGTPVLVDVYKRQRSWSAVRPCGNWHKQGAYKKKWNLNDGTLHVRIPVSYTHLTKSGRHSA